jgi:hypothetical protein
MRFRGRRSDLAVVVENEIVLGEMLQESGMSASSASRSFRRIRWRYGGNGHFVAALILETHAFYRA